ncbi:MAG: glycerophosphodiester phosphodiesterase [Candidatus Hermodarchaeota archaeon]
MNKTFLFIGHRGCRTDFIDENSLTAFQKAIKYGANYIEFDVRKTKDNLIIAMHDETLNRTINHSGRVKDFYYHELKNFKMSKRKENIPQLSEILKIFKGKVKYMIDLKEKKIASDVITLVANQNLINDCIFSGRSVLELIAIKKKFPESKICYNITKGHDIKIEDFLEYSNQDLKFPYEIDMISLKSDVITSKFIETCHKNNILALSWDFYNYSNPLEMIKDLILKGIDGILFDNYKNIPKIKHWLKNKY